ncbi:unnamed protein product [Lathyrus sativus]|nr:unnamed protein product [Lathyrus sativus]
MSGSHHIAYSQSCLKIGHECDLKKNPEKSIPQDKQNKETTKDIDDVRTPTPEKSDADWTHITTASKVQRSRKGMTPTHKIALVDFQNSLTPLRIGDFSKGENHLDP